MTDELHMNHAQSNYILILCNRISGREDKDLADCTDIHRWSADDLLAITPEEAQRKIAELQNRLSPRPPQN